MMTATCVRVSRENRACVHGGRRDARAHICGPMKRTQHPNYVYIIMEFS